MAAVNLFGYMVTRNEVDRYLAECLEDLVPYLDGLFVYDDQTDRQHKLHQIVSKSQAFNVVMQRRAGEAFSFVENEAFFREDAWRLMEKAFSPTEDDWILTLDADEFLRAPYYAYVKEFCQAKQRDGFNGVQLHVHEVWTPITEPPEIRTDGFWADISALRLCQYQPGGKFKDQKLGGGSLPTYVDRIATTGEIDIVHYGYATDTDRQKKYDRYRARTGHSPSHISSILKTPTLAPLPPLRYSA